MTAEEYAEQVKTELGESWLPHIYRERVRTKRTRSYQFEGLTTKARVEIQHTLLGVELKAGRRRLLCPDLATARYLSVFARAGCEQVAVPYDITGISQLADELESSWHRMFLLAGHLAGGRSETFKRLIDRVLIAKIKAEVTAAGAGASIPEFKQTTKQRT
ncbi:MAG TPA: hypothetical protein VGN90_18625 [Pyrinomonadaceae bacterium]|jgi:hypothetical protein|nr:hypothetical protein [Pyrinomonadaceae bacterium]